MCKKLRLIIIAIFAVAGLLLLPEGLQADIPAEQSERIAEAMPTKPIAEPAKQRTLLVFDLCEGYEHSSIPYWNKALEVMGETTGAFEAVISSDMSVFEAESLKRFDGVCFNNTTRLEFTASQKSGLMKFIKSGKGIVGIHAATDNFYDWDEASRMMGGQFCGHPWVADGTWAVKIDDPEHPLMAAFEGENFKINDEIYRTRPPLTSRSRQRVLMSLDLSDEETGSAEGIEPDDKDIAISWVKSVGRGRLFYCSLGHNHHITWNEKVLSHYLAGIQFALGDLEVATQPSLDKVLDNVSSYRYGESREALYKLDDYVRNIIGCDDEKKLYEKRFIDFLKSEAALPGKQYICRKLRLIGSQASVPVLSGMLTNEDTSDMARYALERIPGEQADEALCKAFEETDGKIQVGIINSLGRRGDSKSVRTLAKLMYGSDKTTARAAVNALRQIADDEAISALQKAAGKTAGSLRKLVLDALLDCADELGEKGETEKAIKIYKDLFASDMPVRIRIGALRGTIFTRPENSAGFVVKILETEKPVVQTAAIQLAGQSCAVGNLPEISAKLPDLAARQQIQLLAALEQRGEADVLDDVVEAVKSNDVAVQVAAVKTLGSLQDESVVMLLARSAAEDDKLQEAARESLYRLSAPNVERIILENIPKAKPAVKIELIRAAAKRDAAGAVDVILKNSKSSERGVRIESLKALKTIAGSGQISEVLDLIVNSRSQSERKAAEEILVSVSRDAPERATGKVLSVLKSVEDVKVKCSLLRVLGGVGNETALDTLKAAIKDENAEITKAAIRALSSWPDDSPAELLFNIAETSENRVNKTLALRGFVRLIGLSDNRADEETMGLYKKAMSVASELGEEKRVLSGLAEVRSIQSLRFAEDYLEDEQLGAAAAAVIVRLAPEMFEEYPGKIRRLIRKVIEVSDNEYLRRRAGEMLEEVEEW